MKTTTLVLFMVFALVASPAWAVTVGDITQDLDSNYGAISDLRANLTVNSTNNGHDCTSGSFKSKQNSSDSSKNKFRVDATAPNVGWTICDGTNVDDNDNIKSKTSFVTSTSSDLGWISRGFRETDVLWILDNNTFTLAGSNSTVNGVTCKKIYSTNYDIYVDASEYAKVIRIVRKVSGTATRQYDFEDYVYVESTAWVAKKQVSSGHGETYTSTLSSININSNLSDSYFTVN